jgi:hypothetical protein
LTQGLIDLEHIQINKKLAGSRSTPISTRGQNYPSEFTEADGECQDSHCVRTLTDLISADLTLAMDTDKINLFGTPVKVDSTGKLARAGKVRSHLEFTPCTIELTRCRKK